MEQGLDKITKRFPIGALQPGCNTAMIVAMIINKSDPRKVVSKKDSSERWVTTFTLRDSPLDIINFVVWSGWKDAEGLKKNFHIGEVLEVVRPRILRRDMSGNDTNYNPQVTSWLQLVFVDGKSVIAPHMGDSSSFLPLLRIPSKGTSAFLSVSDILTNLSLKGNYVDILVAVRSVGPEKKIQRKDEDVDNDRSTREVRLFDQTGDCLVLKLWDSELIRLSSDWIPRENVLFLADVRIDYDSWRESAVVTSTSRTVITVNPDTAEAVALLHHAQFKDFSTLSRLDKFAASLDTRQVTRVVNAIMLDSMLGNMATNQDCLVAVKFYGYLTRYDVDCPDAVSLHCGLCSGLLKYNSEDVLICSNIECVEFNNPEPKSTPCQHYNIRADISDETGTLTSVKMNPGMLEKHLGPPSEFIHLSDQTRTGYKWQMMFKPLKLTLALLLQTPESKSSHSMIVDMAPVTYEEMSIKMPSPTSVV